MEGIRIGESCVFRKRRARYYNQGREWFFRTREEAPIGPFAKLSEAVAWATDYARYSQNAPLLEDVVRAGLDTSNDRQLRAG